MRRNVPITPEKGRETLTALARDAHASRVARTLCNRLAGGGQAGIALTAGRTTSHGWPPLQTYQRFVETEFNRTAFRLTAFAGAGRRRPRGQRRQSWMMRCGSRPTTQRAACQPAGMAGGGRAGHRLPAGAEGA
jgi:hypothetical protein